MTQFQDKYYSGFIISTLICFSPFKILAYFSPLIFLLWLIAKTEESERILIRMFKIFIGLGFALLVYSLLYPEFVIQNYLLAMLTYSSVYPIIVVDNKKLATKQLLRRMLKFSLSVYFIEGLIGILQAFYGFLHTGSFDSANGDYVAGTIYPYLKAELALSNPMFAINMGILFIMLLILFLIYRETKKWRIIIGLLAFILASVMHAIIILGIALGLGYLIIKPKLNMTDSKSNKSFSKIFMGTVIIIGAGASIFFLSSNLELLSSNIDEMLHLQYPKAIITYNVLEDLPSEKPVMPVIGLGPGQFSSRASLISSGIYLGGVYGRRALPLLDIKSNPIAENYVFYLMLKFADVKYFGSTQQPYYSFLSVYTETGLIGVVLLLLFLFKIIIKIKKSALNSPEDKFQAFAFCAGTLFLIGIGIQENYWEIPQAVFIGILFLKVVYSIIIYGNDEAE